MPFHICFTYYNSKADTVDKVERQDKGPWLQLKKKLLI